MGLWGRVLSIALLATSAIGAMCHGMMSEPRARNVVHNSDWCAHCLNAGGPSVTYGSGRVWPNSRHGVCGDPITGPLNHEAGGKYATKVITGRYVKGQVITIRITVTAPHGGRFSFGLCPVPNDATEKQTVTQRCFDTNRLINAKDGTPYWWFGKKPAGEYTMDFKLPPGITCKRCVLQWHYESGNSCTIPGTPDQHVVSPGMVDCAQSGNMEEFWNCADVSVVDRSDGADPSAAGFKPPATTKQPKQTAPRRQHLTSPTPDDRFFLALVSLATIAAVAALPIGLAIAASVAAIVFVMAQRYATPPGLARRYQRPVVAGALPAPSLTDEWRWPTRRPSLAKRLENIFRL